MIEKHCGLKDTVIKNLKNLPKKPDIVLKKYKISVFFDGEFLHGKDWKILKPKLEKF